jgi:hypothetical protein
MFEVNYWAILVSGVVSMIIGGLWYGPLFKKPFMRAMGMDKWSEERMKAEQKKMGKMYFLQFFASLLMIYTLAMFMDMLGNRSLEGGLMTAFWVWLGFVMPVQLAKELWGGKMPLFFIGAGNMLVTLLAAGVILGTWL